MKKVYIAFTILIFIIITYLIFSSLFKDISSFTSIRESDVITKEEYRGVVVKKYIDTDQHNYKKVIIMENQSERTLYFDFVLGGFYNFIKVGDSLSKKKGTLDVRLKRKDLDTVITMQIYDRRKVKKDSIIN